jgi:aspartate/glutamate/glutamine transport system substrate-binding protein
MKKLLSLALAILLVLMIPLAAMAESTVTIDKADPVIAKIIERGKLLVGVKADVPKFGYQELGSDFSGLEIDIAKALAKELLGDENAVEFTAVTAKTRGPLLDTGELDLVIATFTIKPDRIVQYDFSKPYFVDAIGLLVKKDAGIASFKDLDGKTIGVAQSATTKDALAKAAEAAGLKIEFLEFATYPDIKAALDSDRVACFSVDKAILMGYVDDSTVLLPDAFESQPYGVAMKKGSAGLLSFVDSKLAAMRASGEIDTLVAKWELTAVDWTQIDDFAKKLWEEAAKLG